MRRCRATARIRRISGPQQLHGSFRPRALGIGDIERNGCQRCNVLQTAVSPFSTGSRAGKRRDRIVRRYEIIAFGRGISGPVDYDPASTAQTYVVRGRVHGSKPRSDSLPTAHSPHPAGCTTNGAAKTRSSHPASCRTAMNVKDVVYTEGFAFNVSYPRNAGTESPYDVYDRRVVDCPPDNLYERCHVRRLGRMGICCGLALQSSSESLG